MKDRYIIVTIDTIMELLKDYCGQDDLPSNAKAVRMMIHPQTQKLAIEAISDDWKSGQEPLDVNFRVKRVYGV